MKEIKGFFGEYRFLSNFAPVTVELDGEVYSSVEHAYVAAKTLNNDDRKLIRLVESPAKVKIIGRSLLLRSNWDILKLITMQDLVEQKFSYLRYAELLLKTGDAYIEETNNWGDHYWGVCNGYGENNLGKILMKVRDGLQELNA